MPPSAVYVETTTPIRCTLWQEEVPVVVSRSMVWLQEDLDHGLTVRHALLATADLAFLERFGIRGALFAFCRCA